jgi:hypothetical protein
MGNTHVCVHRLPAFSTAVLASIASGFLVVAGTTCDFLNVSPPADQMLEYMTEDGIQVDRFDANFGIMCETPPLFVREGDTLWMMSYYFWIASIVIGGFAAMLAWALTTFVGPTDQNWKGLSILSGIAAILQAPIFLMLAAQPCESNTCQISTGCIMLMISTVFWITLTLLSQCQDPPMWAHELNAWRVQKERQQEESTPTAPRRETRLQRWARRKKWASTLGLTKTESGSLHDDGRLELMENGSYYADSNNSRLMLKMGPNGARPGDDQKSVTTFGDLEDMVNFADERRGSLASLLGQEKEHPDDEDEASLLFGEDFVRQTPKEVMVIHSHDDSPMFSSHHGSPNDYEEEKTEERGLLEDDESPRSCLPHERNVKITGLRALAGRMRSQRSRSGYAQLDDDRESDADVEDEIDDRKADYDPPMSPGQISEVSQAETPSPVKVDDPHYQVLLNDWNALHAAATAGILLPTSISVKGNDENEPEPVYYSSEESHSEISLTSFGDYPEDEDLSSAMSGGSSVSSADSQSSDNDDDNSRSRQEKKLRRRRRAFSSTNSVASRRSLLELTIEEETDGDLIEDGSSGDDATKKKKLAEAYTLKGVKSAPDRGSFKQSQAESPYVLRKVESYPITRDLDCVSEDSDGSSQVSALLLGASGMRPVALITSIEEDSLLNTSNDSSVLSSSPGPKTTRRGRSLSVPRRSKFHPITPPARGKSETPKFREERISKAGIHGPAINLISDESSEGSRSSADNRSLRSTVSRRARNARIKRLHADNERRRSRSTPGKRRRPKPESPIIFDPTLRAILVTRQVGVEYGPDEASL